MAIVRLTTCNSIIEANLIKNLLENEEIECFLTNENFTTLMPNWNGILGSGIQVMIDEKDSDRALTLIAPQSSESDLKCPNCNSDNVIFGFGYHRFKKIFFVLFSFLNAVPFSNIKQTYYCQNCKTEFNI